MAYVRWGNDSDVYAYKDIQGGWTLHVAHNRLISGTRKLMGFKIQRTRRLSHPSAGKSFNVESREAMIALLLRLRGERLDVPKYAVQHLLDEIYEKPNRRRS